MSYTSIGLHSIEGLAPDLGLLLAAEMEIWPPNLSNHDTTRWIRGYRDHWAVWRRDNVALDPRRSNLADWESINPVNSPFARLRLDISSPDMDRLALRAMRYTLLWRLDLYVKLLIHIGWQWTTAAQLLGEIEQALTSDQLRSARDLARQQFQQRYDQVGATPDVSGQPHSTVLLATDAQLEAALRSMYADSLDYHTQRLTQARVWWSRWINEANIFQWQASLLDRWDRTRQSMTFTDENSELYETLMTLERLCQPPALFAVMQSDGVDPEEMLAPAPSLWSPADTRPITEFLTALLESYRMRYQHDALVFWLQQSQLPTEVIHSLVLRPDNSAETSHDRGFALARQQRYGEAEEAFRHALALRPDDTDTWTALGFALAEQQRYGEAEAVLRRALTLRPDDTTSSWYVLGVVLYRQQRYGEAEEAYRHILTLRPDDAATWNSLAYAYLYERNYDDALNAISQALSHEPERGAWWDSQGEILLAMERYEEAAEALRRAHVRGYTDDPESYDRLAQALRTLGRDAEADAAKAQAQKLRGSTQS